jgi:Glycosyl hydrolase family 26
MKSLSFLIFACATGFLTPARAEQEITGRFAPPAGKVLVFIGQDNASVGGTAKYKDGYVDHVGVPAGITHYVYFSEGWTNPFKRTFAKGSVAGLNTETEWAAGPMHQKAYVDSPVLDPCLMHVSISMEGNREDKVADGSLDHLIAEFVKFIADHPEHPFLIRIGYEFDGPWNKYDPENFKKAFIRIVDALRAKKLTNFATVMASSGMEKPGRWEKYWPGDDYVDWVGYSYWGGGGSQALAFARKVRKPVFIAESTPKKNFFDKGDHEKIWNGWFEKFFRHINANIDVIRAVSYINSDWDSLDMWDNWGRTQIEKAPLIKERWLQRMAEDRYVNADDNPFKLIGFTPSKAGTKDE